MDESAATQLLKADRIKIGFVSGWVATEMRGTLQLNVRPTRCAPCAQHSERRLQSKYKMTNNLQNTHIVADRPGCEFVKPP